MNTFLHTWVRGSAIATLLGLNALFASTPAIAQVNRSGTPSNTYPQEVVQAFMESCVSTAVDQGQVPQGFESPEQFRDFMVSACSCMIWELQNRYTQEQLMALNEGLRSNDEQANQAMNAVVNSCLAGE